MGAGLVFVMLSCRIWGGGGGLVFTIPPLFFVVGGDGGGGGGPVHHITAMLCYGSILCPVKSLHVCTLLLRYLQCTAWHVSNLRPDQAWKGVASHADTPTMNIRMCTQ